MKVVARYTRVPGRDVDLDAEDVRDKQGRRVTSDYAERAAEDAVRQVRAGRPSLAGARAHSPRVSVRVPSELRDLLRDRAEREGKRPSEVIRDALDEYLKAS